MILRIAITRALPDAERTAERLRQAGAEAVVAPLLRIVPCAYDTNVDGAQALLFTSTNGVRAFPDARNQRDRLVLTVGDATAEAARDAGFANVHSADGDVSALAKLASSLLDPRSGKLIHIGGDHVAGDLAGQLTHLGFTVERRVAYASIASTELPPAFASPLDVVMFHSARAAQAFAQLGAPNAPSLIAACISQAVADAASVSPWQQIRVAEKPREDTLIRAALLR